MSNNAALIAEARAHTYASRSPHPLAFRLADALEAADRDRERLDALWAETTHEAIRETDRANAAEKRAAEAEARSCACVRNERHMDNAPRPLRDVLADLYEGDCVTPELDRACADADCERLGLTNAVVVPDIEAQTQRCVRRCGIALCAAL